MINSFDTGLQQQQHTQGSIQRQNRQSTPERLEVLRDSEKIHLDKKLKTFFNAQNSHSPQQFQPQKQNLMSTMKKSNYDQKWVAYSDQKNTRGIYYRVNVKEIDNNLRQKRFQSNSPNKSSLQFGQLYEQSLKQSIEVYANDNQYLSHEQRMYLQKLLKQEGNENRGFTNSNSNQNLNEQNTTQSNTQGDNKAQKSSNTILPPMNGSPSKSKGEFLNNSITYTQVSPIPPNFSGQQGIQNQNSPKSHSPVGNGVKTEGDVREQYIRQENYRQLWNRLLPYLEKPKFLKGGRQHSQPNQNGIIYPQQFIQMNTQPDERGMNTNNDLSLNASEYYQTLNQLDRVNQRPLPLIHQTKQQLQQQQLLQQSQQKSQVKDKLRDSYYQLDMFANGVRQERSFHQVRNYNANNRTQSITPEKPVLKNNSQYHSNGAQLPQTNPFMSQHQSGNHNQQYQQQRADLKSPNNRYYSNSIHRQQGPTPVMENGKDLVKQYKECTELLSLVQVNLSNIVSNMANKKTPKGDFQSRKVQAISSSKADQFSKTIFYDGKVRKKGMEKMILPSLYITRNSPTMEQQNSPNAMQQKSRSSSVLRQDEHIITNEFNNSKTFSHQVPGLEKQHPETFDDLEYQQDFEDDHSVSKSNVFQQTLQQPSKSQSQQNIQKGGNLTPVQEHMISRTEDISQSLMQSQMRIIEKEQTPILTSLNQSQAIISQNNLVSSTFQSPTRSQEINYQQATDLGNLKNSQLSVKTPSKSIQESPQKSAQIELQQISETPQLGQANSDLQALHQIELEQQQKLQEQQQLIQQQQEQLLQQQLQIQQQSELLKQQQILLQQEQALHQKKLDEQYKQHLEQDNPQQNTLQQDELIEEESQFIENEVPQQDKKLQKSQEDSLQMSSQQSPTAKNLQSSQLSKKSTLRKSRASSSRQSKAKIKEIPDNSRNSQSRSPQRQSQILSPKKNELNASQQSFKQTIDKDNATPTPSGDSQVKSQRQKSQSPPKSLTQSQLQQSSEKKQEARKSVELQKEAERLLSQKAAAAAAAAEEERLRILEEERKKAEEEEKELMKPLLEQIKQLDKEKLKDDIQDFNLELLVNRYTGNLQCRMTFGDINDLKEQSLNLRFVKKFDNQRKRVFKIERQMNVFKLPVSLLSNRQFITEKNKYNNTQFFECSDCCIETKSLENYNVSEFKEFLITQFINQQIFHGDSRESSCINVRYIGIYHDEEFYQCDTLLIEYEKFETLDEIIADKLANQQNFTEYDLLISYLQMLLNYQQLIQNNIVHQNINATKIAYSFADCKFKFMPLSKAHSYNFGDFSPRETITDKFMIKGDQSSHPVWIDLVNLAIVFAQMKLLDRAQNKSVLEKINPSDKTISIQIIKMLCSNKCEATLNECIELIYQNISQASFVNLVLQPIKYEVKSDFEKCKKMRIIAKTYENIHQLKDACSLFTQLATLKETVYGKHSDEHYQGLCDELFIYYKDGQVQQLEPLYEKCQEYFKVIPSLPSSVEYLHYIAEIQWRLGKEQESEEFFDKAFNIISTSGDKIDSRYMTNIFNNKGVNELSRDAYEKSISYFEEALKYSYQQPQLNKMMLSSILNNYSISLLKINRLEESLENMLKSLEVKKEIDVLNSDPEGSKMAYAISMLYKQTKNDVSKSLEYVDLALQLQEYHQNYLEQVKYIYKKTQLYFEINEQQNAIDAAMEALPHIEKCELTSFRQIIQITYDMACLFKNKNLKPQAITFFSKAYDVGVRLAGPQVLAVQQIKKEIDKLK